MVVAVGPRWRERDRCGVCRRRCPGFDLGEGRRRWRALDLELGPERCKQVQLLSCDVAGWIAAPVAERLPNAERCVDPFHIVMLATNALDYVRREIWNQARRAGEIAAAKDLKGARFALCMNSEPHLPPIAQARPRPGHKQAAVPCLPTQAATPPDQPAPASRRDRAPGWLGEVGAPLPAVAVPQARPSGSGEPGDGVAA